jgi:hypothetical protein
MGRRRRRKKVAPDQSREAQKVYVETSVWGMTLEDQPRALRDPTKQFLRQCTEGLFLPFISTVVPPGNCPRSGFGGSTDGP